MALLPNFSETIKGVLLIVAGTIILLDATGFTTEMLHTTVLIGSIIMIGFGIFMCNIHKKVYALLAKKDDNEPRLPEQ